MFHLFLLIQITVLFLELFLQSARQTLTQNPIRYLRIIQSLIFYQFSLNLSLFLIFKFLPYFQILVMLWFKNPILILIHLSLVLQQIQLHNIPFVNQKQNSQALRFLSLRNLLSQFLQPIAIIFLFSLPSVVKSND